MSVVELYLLYLDCERAYESRDGFELAVSFFKYFQIEHIKKVLEFLWKKISPCKAVKIVWYSIMILEAMACVISLG